jgi:hypothetical protein
MASLHYVRKDGEAGGSWATSDCLGLSLPKVEAAGYLVTSYLVALLAYHLSSRRQGVGRSFGWKIARLGARSHLLMLASSPARADD